MFWWPLYIGSLAFNNSFIGLITSNERPPFVRGLLWHLGQSPNTGFTVTQMSVARNILSGKTNTPKWHICVWFSYRFSPSVLGFFYMGVSYSRNILSGKTNFSEFYLHKEKLVSSISTNPFVRFHDEELMSERPQLSLVAHLKRSEVFHWHHLSVVIKMLSSASWWKCKVQNLPCSGGETWCTSQLVL